MELLNSLIHDLELQRETPEAVRKPGIPRWTVIIGFVTLLSRLMYLSKPYFVDGPGHVNAIASGAIFIQPPGYFLFGETAHLLSAATSLQPSASILLINIAFSAVGSFVFACLAARLFSNSLAILLSLCYAFSDISWFVSEIHSSYASMLFFGPVLIFTLEFTESYWLGGMIWALMSGFRPSDGVFVLPFVIWTLRKRNSKQVLSFLCTAVPTTLLWYVPTYRHFGESLTSPLGSAHNQVHGLANGLLTNVANARKVANLVHILTGAFDSWNVLLPFIFIGMFVKEQFPRRLSIYVIPGCLFYVFYFFSDAAYYSYMVAAGMLLAGFGLRRLNFHVARALLVVSIVISVVQMAILKPFPARTKLQAVINCYCLQYSGWALKHQCYRGLKESLDELEVHSD
jgi:hypothetical protein